MRKVQEDAQAQQLALVAQRGVLEGQGRAATERIKQLEVSPGHSRPSAAAATYTVCTTPVVHHISCCVEM